MKEEIKEKIKKEVYDFVKNENLTKEELKYIDDYFLNAINIIDPFLDIELDKDQVKKLALKMLNGEKDNV